MTVNSCAFPPPHDLMSDVIRTRRRIEQYKYHAAYQDPNYRMGVERRADANEQLLSIYARNIKEHWALLDVGCGRGEILEDAAGMGFFPVHGIETLPILAGSHVQLGEITEIPVANNVYPAVTCFDVLEHLPPEDTVLALRELWRVASHVVLVSISNCRSVHRGVDLHPNIRSYDEWEELLVKCWTVNDVTGAYDERDSVSVQRWDRERVEQVSETHVSRTWRAWKIKPEA